EIDENILTLKNQMTSQCIGYVEHQSQKERNSVRSQRNIESLLDYLTGFR
ncbi:dethiobiotin synthase, partial [Cycloclasticus sp. 44_32_T64]